MLSGTELEPQAKRQRTRRVVFPDIDEITDFAIDEDEYRVFVEILSMEGVQGDSIAKEIRYRAQVEKKDEKRRISSLHLTSNGLPNLACAGQLAHLRSLTLSGRNITAIPHTIGHLQNLDYLHLYNTQNLSKLPDDIGNLANLRLLLIYNSPLQSLPPSIGQLGSLRGLKIGECPKMLQLPEEIGDLTSLSSLIVYTSGITSLPNSITQLKNLEWLNVLDTAISEGYWANLANRVRSLVEIDCGEKNDNPKLCYALACNRARSKTQNSTLLDMPKLWPLVLDAIPRLFCEGKVWRKYKIPKADCVYHLLLEDGREPFLMLLMDRHRMVNAKS